MGNIKVERSVPFSDACSNLWLSYSNFQFPFQQAFAAHSCLIDSSVLFLQNE